MRTAFKAKNSVVTQMESSRRFVLNDAEKEDWIFSTKGKTDNPILPISYYFQTEKKTFVTESDAVVNNRKSGTSRIILQNARTLLECLENLSSFPKVEGKKLLDLIRDKIYTFFLLDSILHAQTVSKSQHSGYWNTLTESYKNILDKAFELDTPKSGTELDDFELTSIFKIGLYLTEAHDFCNLISVAGICLLASCNKNKTIIDDYNSKFDEEIQTELKCEENFQERCNKKIAFQQMQTLLEIMVDIMQQKRTRWEKAVLENHVKLLEKAGDQWMLNEKVVYVLEMFRFESSNSLWGSII
jgi:hypothetical protein